jgi:hypothetical protein
LPPESPGGRRGLGAAGAAAIKECEDQLSACTALYVEDQLSSHFKGLLEYVKRAEQAQKRNAIPDGQQIPGEMIKQDMGEVVAEVVGCKPFQLSRTVGT